MRTTEYDNDIRKMYGEAEPSIEFTTSADKRFVTADKFSTAYYPMGVKQLSSVVKGLFSAGEQGVWYDPSDLTTLFQDAAGTTPVTAVEQPVGLMLDKSGRGNHAYQTTSAARPVLSARVNEYVGTETLATQNVTTLVTSYKLTFTGTGTITLSGTATGSYSAGTHTITCTAGTLTSTVAGTVTKADIRASNTGVNLPPYQSVNTPTDYDTVGFPLYIKPNGSSQSMMTNSIDFTTTDKMTVVTGVRKLSDAANSQILELSSDWYFNNGSFALSAPFGASTTTVAFVSKGTTAVAYQNATVVAPSTSVVRGIGSIGPPVCGVAINGVYAQYTSSQGAGNYGNYPLYLFARNGASLWFGGRFYGAVIRGAVTDANNINYLEQYMNLKTKAY